MEQNKDQIGAITLERAGFKLASHVATPGGPIMACVTDVYEKDGVQLVHSYAMGGESWSIGAAVRSESVADAATDQLYGAVMTIPCTRTMSHFVSQAEMRTYKEGHRDARHAAADLVAAFSSSARAADAPSEPSELPTAIRDGMHWPEGYVTDPNGKIIPPKGRFNDFEFGYNVGYGEGLQSIKDTVANIGAQAVAKSRAADALDSQPTESEQVTKLKEQNRADFMRWEQTANSYRYRAEAAEAEYEKCRAAHPASSQPTDGGVRK